MDKQFYQEEMCSFKFSILMYIYVFNYKKFFETFILTEWTIL